MAGEVDAGVAPGGDDESGAVVDRGAGGEGVGVSAEPGVGAAGPGGGAEAVRVDRGVGCAELGVGPGDDGGGASWAVDGLDALCG